MGRAWSGVVGRGRAWSGHAWVGGGRAWAGDDGENTEPFHGDVRWCAVIDHDFELAFDGLFKVAYRAAYPIIGNREEAEDCAQEACARALVRWAMIADHAEPFVARVAINQAIDRGRKLTRGKRIVIESPEWGTDEHAAFERRRILVEALSKLPRRQREAVALRYLADLPERDVAEALGWSLGTVKSMSSWWPLNSNRKEESLTR